MMKPVKIEFTEKNLTGNAGLVHFGRFIQKLNLKEILMKQISIPRAPNAVYQVSDAIIITQLATYTVRQRILNAIINDMIFKRKPSFVTAWIFFGKKFVI